jgi:hypothetical protein
MKVSRQPLPQLVCHCLLVDGLGNVVVHAGGEAFFPVTPECIGRKGEYGRAVNLSCIHQGTKLASRLVAVHLRHLHIEQHNIKPALAAAFDGRATAFRHGDFAAHHLQ